MGELSDGELEVFDDEEMQNHRAGEPCHDPYCRYCRQLKQEKEYFEDFETLLWDEFIINICEEED